jgi:proline iminopeptidase
MMSFGEPPYEDLFAYAFVMGYYETLEPFTPLPETARKVEDAGIGMLGIMASEYSLMDKLNVARGLIDTFSVMYPQLQEIDFREDAAQLEIPVYLIHGKYELNARGSLVLDYFDQLQAPRKMLIEFEHGSHAPAFDDPERFHELLVETILPETYPESETSTLPVSDERPSNSISHLENWHSNSLRSYVGSDQEDRLMANQ